MTNYRLENISIVLVYSSTKLYHVTKTDLIVDFIVNINPFPQKYILHQKN